MPRRPLLLVALAAVTLVIACSDSPTEPRSPKSGTLVIVTHDCSLACSLHLALDGGGDYGEIRVPGETRIEVPPGRHRLDFWRGGDLYVGGVSVAGYVEVPEGGSATIVDPPGYCVARPGTCGT